MEKNERLRSYRNLDEPEVTAFLFHPRPEWPGAINMTSAEDVLIPVENDIVIGGRFHMAQKSNANILFFHGNGEIVSDYDQFGQMYNQMGVNFLAVDYRGYGRSTGNPTVSAMLQDSHTIFSFVKDWLNTNGYNGPLIVMGRSLGSASALEIALEFNDTVDALIIESGFAYTTPLLRLIGVDVDRRGIDEENGIGNLDKIRGFDKPTVIIHAEYDQIIPFSDAQALFEASPATDKKIVKIPGANHNDIFAHGFSKYMEAVTQLTKQL